MACSSYCFALHHSVQRKLSIGVPIAWNLVMTMACAGMKPVLQLSRRWRVHESQGLVCIHTPRMDEWARFQAAEAVLSQ